MGALICFFFAMVSVSALRRCTAVPEIGKFCKMTISKLFLAFLLILVSVGCDKTPKAAEPTLETTPWLFPGPNIEQLAASDFMARAVAARSLGRMGAKAEAAIPELERLIKEDKNSTVREIAAESLEKIRAATGGAS